MLKIGPKFFWAFKRMPNGNNKMPCIQYFLDEDLRINTVKRLWGACHLETVHMLEHLHQPSSMRLSKDISHIQVSFYLLTFFQPHPQNFGSSCKWKTTNSNPLGPIKLSTQSETGTSLNQCDLGVFIRLPKLLAPWPLKDAAFFRGSQ